MSPLGDLEDNGFRFFFAYLMVKLDEKAIAPRLASGESLNSTDVHAMARERQESVQQGAGHVARGEEQRSARGRAHWE